VADNIFAKNPLDATLEGMTALKTPPQSPRAAFEAASRSSGVPINILLAAAEASGAKTGEDAIRVVEAVSGEWGGRIRAGEPIERVVGATLGGDEAATAQFLDRARALGREYYPDLAPKEPGFVGNVGRVLGASLVRGGGMAAEGVANAAASAMDSQRAILGGIGDAARKAADALGVKDFGGYVADELGVTTAAEWADRGAREAADRAQDAGRFVGDAAADKSDSIREGLSDRARQAMAGSTPDGVIYDPRTWSLGENASLEGYTYHAVDVLGSLIPVILAGIATGGIGAAAVGAAMGGGEGSQTARQVVDEAYKNGTLDQSPMFRRLVAEGASPDDAYDRVRREAAKAGTLFQAPVSAFGGYATASIVKGTVGKAVGGGIMRRAIASGVASAAEEGLQEAAETVSANLGIKATTGLKINIADGTFGDFVLGAIGGAGPGAVGGALGRGHAGDPSRRPPVAAPPQEPPEPEPDGGIPAAGGQQPVPAAPDLAPEPSPLRDAARAAPPPAAGDIAPGSRVILKSSDSAPPGERVPDMTGTFVGEKGRMVLIADEDGEVVEIPRNAFDLGAVSMQALALDPMLPETDAPADPEAPPQPDMAQAPQPDLQPPAPAAEVPPPQEIPPAVDVSPAPDVPEDVVRRRLRMIEDIAKRDGWTADLIAQRDAAREAVARIGASMGVGPEPRPPNPETEDTGDVVEPGRASEGQGDHGVGSDRAAPVARLPDAGSPAEGMPAVRDPEPDPPPSMDPGPRALTQETAEKKTVTPDLVTVRDVYGKRHRVRKPDLDGDRAMLPTFNANGERTNGTLLHRDNIDPDGSGVRATYASAPYIAKENDRPFATEAAAKAAVRHVNQDLADFKIKPVNGGFVAVRKKAKPDAETAPETPDALSIEDIRTKAAILRGWTGDKPPVVDGVLFSHDVKAGGYTFSRKHKEKVGAALKVGAKPAAGEPLTGEIITPEDDAEARRKAATSVGIELTDAPLPVRAPWWTDASPEVRAAILDAAGPQATRDARQTHGWENLSDATRRALLDAHGRLYRAGEITNVGTIEAPRYALAGAKPDGSPALPDKDAARIWNATPPARREAIVVEAGWVVSSGVNKGHASPVGRKIAQRTWKEHPENIASVLSAAMNRLGMRSALEDTISGTNADTESASQENPATTDQSEPTQTAASPAVPTPAQAEAGNYRMKHVSFQGLDITIETEKGQERRGKDKDGEEWSVTMPADYGYIKRTEGADGDHVDAYLGDMADSDFVLIVNQVDADTGAFDEHKVILGAMGRNAALDIYRGGFSDGRANDRIGSFTATNIAGFKAWLAAGPHKAATQNLDFPFKKKAADTDRTQSTPIISDDKPAADPDTAEQAAIRARIEKEEKANPDPKPVIDFRDMTQGVEGLALIRALRLAGDDAATRQRTANEWVHGQFKRTGMEHLVVLDREGKLLVAAEGSVNHVGFPNWLSNYAKTKMISYNIHNHPSNRGPSPGDLAAAASGFRPVHIIGADKALRGYSPTPTFMEGAPKSIFAYDAIREIIDTIDGAVVGIIQAQITNGAVKIDDANVLHSHAVARAMAEAGALEITGNDMAAEIDAAGINQGEINERVAEILAPWLRRTGQPVAKVGDQGAAEPAESDTGTGRRGEEADTADREDAGRGDAQGRVPTPAAVKPAKAGSAAVQLKNWTGLEVNAYDDETSDDGRNSKVKNEWKSDATRFGRAIAAILKDAGFTAPLPGGRAQRGKTPKPINPVSWNASGIAGSGEVSVSLDGPDGFGVYIHMDADGRSMGGESPVRIYWRVRKNTDSPYGGEMNQWVQDKQIAAGDITDMILKAIERRAAQPEAAKPEPTPQPMTEDPKIPRGYELTYIKRATGPEARANGFTPGEPHKAVIRRDQPYGVYDFVGKTRADAIAGALRLAMKPATRPTPQVPPMAGMTPMGAKPEPDATKKPSDVEAEQAETDPGTVPTSSQTSPPTNADNPAIIPITEPPKKSGALSNLSQAKQDRAALLRARIADRLKNQLNTGVDPALLVDAIELAGIYIESGFRKFRDVLKAVAADMGLTEVDAEPWVRAGYNEARDGLELADEDVSDMDDSKAVLAHVRDIRKAAKEGLEKPVDAPISDAPATEGEPDEPQTRTGRDGRGNEGRESGADRQGNLGTGEPDGNRGDRDLEEQQPDTLPGDEGTRRTGGDGTRRGPSDTGAGQADDQSGDAAVGSPDGSLPRPDDAGLEAQKPDEPASPARSNYRIDDPEALVGGTPKRRFARNREAIEAYQSIRDEAREPTPQELDAMASYIGWGSFGQQLFQGTWTRPRFVDGWKSENEWLRQHLGKDEWEDAQRSIINAHYTDPPTVRAMWGMVERLGFKGGRVLEPSMGIGNFFGMMPAQLAANSQLTGIELDSLTGGMAKLLYPRAAVSVMGYQDSRTPDNFYDLVIGNWPFANIEVPDRRYMKLKPSLHDYFFLKALDQVRPGGLVVGITSAFTMDKKATNIRAALARRADLVATFRLPSGAFEKYAGTSVVTDIIILQKRQEPILDISGVTWVRTAEVDTPAGTPVTVNQTYADNPDKVLGTLNFGTGSTYGAPSMIVDRPADLLERLEALPATLPEGVYTATQRGKEPRFISNHTTAQQNSVTEVKGVLYQVQGERLVRFEDVAKYKVKDAKKTAAREAEIIAFIDMREKLGAVIDADRAGTEDADTKRKALRKAFDAFRKAHGNIADSLALSLLLRAKDPGAPMVQALEAKDGTPAAILSRPTIRAPSTLENPSIRDAFVIARNESVAFDLERVAALAKAKPEEVIADLAGSGAIYRTPGGAYEVADAYLSGNVRQKLREAKAAAEAGEDMAASISALEKVLPPFRPYYDIEAKLGAMWIPDQVYMDFLTEKLGMSPIQRQNSEVRWSAGAWRPRLDPSLNHKPEASSVGHSDVRIGSFISHAMNNQTIIVKYRDNEGEHKDEKASEEANAKAAKLREDFSEWVWSDPERRHDLELAYNEQMNAIATPQFDGSFLDFQGMALQRGDQEFNLRRHQANAIWRGILNGRGIYAHEVGTGKTITMAGIAVESRRYGKARKPLVVAHNANSKAVANEMQETYPGGKFLYIDNLAPGEIEAEMRRIATDDWDAVIIPHSLLDRMALSQKTLEALAAKEIEALEAEALAAAAEDGADLTLEDMDDPDAMKKVRSPTAKQLVKARENIIASIQKAALRASKDGAVPFEDLGIDMLIVDESHEFKKPSIATRMTVKGLNKATSARSIQLKFLSDYIRGQNNGRGVHVFTGTPITNTLTEIYHQMRYVMEDVMEQSNISAWDGFFNTFAASVPDIELTSAGDYQSVERLSSFVNVPELRRMAGQYMDIVFADDMPEMQPRRASSGKTLLDSDLTKADRDELRNGRQENPEGRPYKEVIHDIADMEPDQRRILDQSIRFARQFRVLSGRDKIDVMRRGGPDAPIVFDAVPSRAGLDIRLHEIDAEDSPTSKANRAVRNVTQIYNEDKHTTQVIFMDEGYSDSVTRVKKKDGEVVSREKVEKFNLAKDIVAKLVAAGIPEAEIAIVNKDVSKEQRAKISEQMNNLQTRVVIGLTSTLGVGVNMQKYLRAMHHLDAPWMPGDLEQRNGRGQRQGNEWNTVLEYRYLTEGLDGRRWQVLTIKDRFIKAFLKAEDGVRVIEGDATDDATSMGADDLAATLSEAAGDPRIFQVKKLEKDIERLQRRERLHVDGVADARRKVKKLRDSIPRTEDSVADLERATEEVAMAREKGFTATIDGKTFDSRDDAAKAMDALVQPIVARGGHSLSTEWRDIPASVQGFQIQIKRSNLMRDGQVLVDFRVKYDGVGDYDTMGAPSVASAEAVLRKIADRLERARTQLAEDRASADRIEKAAAAPFQQAEALKKKKVQVEALLQDLKDNPVAPPSWLRQGAPIDSVIHVDKKPRAVTGHRWTKDGWFVSTEAGDVPYLDARSETGVPLYQERPFEPPQIEEGSKLRTGDERDEAEMSEPRPPPVTSLTGDELGIVADIRELGRAAEGWYTDNLIGKSVVNAETGWDIRFSRRGAKKIGGRKGEYLYRIVPALAEIVRGGHLIGTEIDRGADGQTTRWHRFSAAVELAGVIKDVIITVREAPNGKFHYDLSRDTSDGARFFHASPPVSEAGARQDDARAASLNIDEVSSFGNGAEEIPDADIAAIAAEVDSLMRRIGLAGTVRTDVVRAIIDAAGTERAGASGLYSRGAGRIQIRADAVAGPIPTLRHEIIHALRDAALWGRDYGLFTREEWRALVRSARADKAAVKDVDARYPNLPEIGRTEELVAELYRKWATGEVSPGLASTALGRIRSFFMALANALRGRGFTSTAAIFRGIERGDIAARAMPRDASGQFISLAEAAMVDMSAEPEATTETAFDRKERKFLSNLLTDAMGGRGRFNLLALVPGRPLFTELGRKMPSALTFLRIKEEMDATRQEWHEASDRLATDWRGHLSRDGAGNRAMMDLMHDATIAGLDPSKPYKSAVRDGDERLAHGDDERAEAARGRLMAEPRRRAKYDRLQARFRDLSPDFQRLFGEVRDMHKKMGADFERTILDNVRKAMEIASDRAREAYDDEMRRIRDEGLQGAERTEAEKEARKKRDGALRRQHVAKAARLASLRSIFETNKVEEPYFPLMRFGKYVVTVRDEEGKVISFSKFESEAKQQAFAAEMRAIRGQTVQIGTMDDDFTARKHVDPNFVADVEEMIGDTVADPEIMDAIWQRWLDTLPDMSVRKSRIHRKGTPGYSDDAFRAFGYQMFHGAHQLARLKYTMDLDKAVEDAKREAAASDDPNRTMLVVSEMERRKAFTMNPTGSATAQMFTSAAFIYYLGFTPAAAMVNLTQTTVVGIPILSSAFEKGGVARASRELMRAAGDFGRGKAHAERSSRLTEDERAALAEAYRRGTIDKSQAHDLAGVGETGIEPDSTMLRRILSDRAAHQWVGVRKKAMAGISFMFHHTERANREITFLAAYRMAKDNGFTGEAAIDKAGDVTWKTHFDYQNSSRPRLMQNDTAKVLLVFRNFQLNMLWRLFRDTHQAFAGETPQLRREARGQLIGITAMLMLHAGVRGVWGYAIIMGLLSLLPGAGTADDLEDEIKTALVNLFGPYVAGLILNGVPGQVLGVDLTARIGMPELWFRSSDRNLEGDDAYNYWLQQMVGAVPGMFENGWRGMSMIGDGEVARGIEAMMPKAARDWMKTYRYLREGVTTYRGDPLIDNLSATDAIKQAIGFTPAKVSERYEENTRLRNREGEIMGARKRVLNDAAAAIKRGKGLPSSVLESIDAFNRANPDYPITGDTIRQSMRSRLRYSDQTEGGVRLNPKLNERLRREAAPRISGG
jgi:N12 class adenine-specific DNA methylase